MRPALTPGVEVVATDSRRPKPGEIVVFPHPHRVDFWLVKRMVDPPTRLGEGEAWVLSDNEAGTADSRTLGPVPIETLRPLVTRLDPDTFVEAIHLLTGEDDALAGVIERHGSPRFWRRQPGFATLVLFILEQQVSLESGAAVYRRLTEAAGGVTPETIVSLGPEGILRAGATRQKTGYIVRLATSILDGEIDLDDLEGADPVAARATLLSISGVGPWTADVYLLSALGHPDMFPVGDRALQVGTAEVLEMNEVPDISGLEILSETWRPIRAVAARLIWHAYLSARGRVEPDTVNPYL